MYWLIENIEKIDILSRMGLKEAYVEIIPFTPNNHPIQNQISCVYIKPLIGNKGYMVSIEHSETISLDMIDVQFLLNSIEKIYTPDKKEFLHYLNHNNVVSLLPSFPTFEKHKTQSHNHFYNILRNQYDVNTVIPIVKHYEACEKNFDILKPYFIFKANSFNNDKLTVIFNIIESNGIKVDPELFQKHFKRETEEYIYTQYNLNTTTMRPSNKFGGINFAALNKNNGERECFIPRNDFFIEMDISAMHPTILANLLDYSFPNSDVHESFAEMYGVDYAQAKEITFKQMYGGVWKEYEHLEFFQKLITYSNSLWDDFQNKGYIECPISKHIFRKDKLDDMNPQKLLNYVLQNLETSVNALIMWDILKLLRGKNTKLVLYVYDSFLFDIDKTEKEIMLQIHNIFSKYKLQTKHKKGINYNFN
jgi:hypothetical protein